MAILDGKSDELEVRLAASERLVKLRGRIDSFDSAIAQVKGQIQQATLAANAKCASASFEPYKVEVAEYVAMIESLIEENERLHGAYAGGAKCGHRFIAQLSCRGVPPDGTREREETRNRG